MAELRLKVENFDVIERKLAALPERIRKNYLRGALRAGLSILRKEARALVPVQTGVLKRSIRSSAKVLYGGATLIGKVNVGGRGARHSHLVEFGTRAHDIYAKPGRALNVPGHPVRHVRHPGARPKPYMEPALRNKRTQALSAFETYINTRVQRFWETGR